MTNMAKAGEAVVLKTDTLGRVKMTAAQRERVLDEFERSGLSGAKFAQLAGIKYQTLATWLQKRRKQGKSAVKAADPVKWLEAVMEQASPRSDSTALVLQLPGGASAELHHLGQIPLAAALVRALAQSC